MAPGSIDVVLQPLGKEVGVLEAPLAKYKPEIVVLITNMEKSIKLVEGHLKNQWRNTAGKHKPRVIPKLIGEPWTERTVEEYMEAFNFPYSTRAGHNSFHHTMPQADRPLLKGIVAPSDGHF